MALPRGGSLQTARPMRFHSRPVKDFACIRTPDLATLARSSNMDRQGVHRRKLRSRGFAPPLQNRPVCRVAQISARGPRASATPADLKLQPSYQHVGFCQAVAERFPMQRTIFLPRTESPGRFHKARSATAASCSPVPGQRRRDATSDDFGVTSNRPQSPLLGGAKAHRHCKRTLRALRPLPEAAQLRLSNGRRKRKRAANGSWTSSGVCRKPAARRCHRFGPTRRPRPRRLAPRSCHTIPYTLLARTFQVGIRLFSVAATGKIGESATIL